MNTAQWRMNSPAGPIYLVASEKGLEGVLWSKPAAPVAGSLRTADPKIRILARAAAQLKEYFCGKRKKFGLPLAFGGTPFQKKIWTALSEIPYGETLSYKNLAGRVGNPKAARAAGTAAGKNPLCVVLPCHRVIASNGSLGGYSGGLKIKSGLLALEKN